MNRVMRSYEELNFSDDFMFCKVLINNLDLCKELLELVLDVPIREIRISNSQKSIDITYDGKGVRFDVYVEDEANTVYDIEMQNITRKDLPKRMRYYQGMIDLNLIEKGSSYNELRKSYIIFICKEMPFEKNLPVYTFKNVCVQDNSISLGDDTVKVVLNASGNREGLSSEMCAFLDFVKENKVESKLTKDLQNAVNAAISKKEWEVEYMTWNLALQDAKIEGREEGIEQGIESTIRTFKKYDAEDDVIISSLMEDYGLSKEEAKERLKIYSENQV